MKTHTIKTPTAELETLKNNYAQEQGYEDWHELYMLTDSIMVFQMHMDEICIRAQKAALEKAAENADTDEYHGGEIIGVDRTSITNPENLIR